jgi:hypothetical protein
MQKPKRSQETLVEPNITAGWDVGVAAVALAFMTAGFWRLWPNALQLSDAPIGPLILKSAVAALGFVGVATRWEDTMRAIARNPLVLVLMALASCSAFWAFAPAEAFRNSIIFIVIWFFGIALTLRFRPRDLAEICAFAGLFGLMAQFAAHQGMPPVSVFDGDVAFAIIGSAWAALCVPARRSLWFLVLGSCCALAFAAGDLPSLGAVVGFLIGLGVAQLGAIRSRNGAISVIVTAWVLVAMIIAVTLFVLFGADPVSNHIARFFDALGPSALIGQGFGVGGQSMASAFGAGLGVVGIALIALIVFASLFQMLLAENRQSKGGDITNGFDTNIVVWFASFGAIIVSPSEVAVFSPLCIAFAATSFAISMSLVAAPRQRRSLRSTQAALPSTQTRRRAQMPVSGPVQTPSKLNAMGLRPKRLDL